MSGSQTLFAMKLFCQIYSQILILGISLTLLQAQGTSFAFPTGEGKSNGFVGKYSSFATQEVHLYGGGSLLSQVTGDTSVNKGATGLGNLGIVFLSERMSCDVYYSFNSADTIQVNTLNQFGTALMGATRKGQSASLDFRFAFLQKDSRKSPLNRSGLALNANISNQIWKIDSTNFSTSPFTVKLGFYTKVFEYPHKRENNGNQAKLVVTPSLVFRQVLGNFNNEPQLIDNKTIKPRGYHSFEISVDVFVNNIQAFVKVNQFLRSTNDILIPGVNGTQVSIGANIAGKLLDF